MDQLLAIRAFVRIAEAGSFAKAADSLNLPRSTVSKLVQDLEHHLGTRLVQRTTRAVTVTPEGAAYRERAVRLLGELEDMDATAAHARALPRGRLRVDIGSSLANLVLIPALPDFRARYPDVQLFLGVNDRPIDLIGEGVDCVIRGGALADSALVARRLCELDFVTCAAPSYLEAHGVPAHPAEIESGHMVCSYCSALTGKVFPLHFQRGEERHEVAGPPIVGVNESTAHVTALLAGLGIGQTFGFVARPFLEDGRLVRILPDWTQSPFPLQLVHPANRHPSAKLRVFSDWVAALFGRIDHRAG